MKRFFCLIICAFSLLLPLCLVASAEEVETVPTEPEQVTTAPEVEQTAPEQTEEDAVPWSTFVSNALGEYAGEILSALAFAGSGVLIFLFKKGLLPTVSKMLASLGDKSKDAADAAKKALETASEVAKNTSATVEEMNAKLEEFEKNNGNKIDSYKAVIAMQTEMIGSLLLNLRLTPDQRGAVENTMADIKKAMEGGDAR